MGGLQFHGASLHEMIPEQSNSQVAECCPCQAALVPQGFPAASNIQLSFIFKHEGEQWYQKVPFYSKYLDVLKSHFLIPNQNIFVIYRGFFILKNEANPDLF